MIPSIQKKNSLVKTCKLRKKWWMKISTQVTQVTIPDFNMSIRIGRKQKEVVENTRNTTHYVANLQKCHSISQILENMKTAYAEHAKRVGKILPQDWDTVGLEKPILPRGAKGMANFRLNMILTIILNP